ncbi:MAG TPA: HlyD family secretion protein [Acetobacteraceae bacterium]|nr:HlyD family secretion protein [Acetobacteraceae bacterium]
MDDHTTTTELPPPGPTVRGLSRSDQRDLLSSRQRNRRASYAKWVLLLIVLTAAIGGATHWYLTKDEASTDDAYTDGRAITVAPQVAGTVVALHVADNQRVKAGDVMLEIDPRAYIAARDQAQGSLQVAEAQLANARINLEWAKEEYPAKLAAAQAALAAARAGHFKADADARRQRSLPKQATTQQEIDTAAAALSSAVAQVDQAQAAVRQAELVPQYIGEAEAQVRQLEAQVALVRAQLDQANLNLSWTEVTAPQDGWITKRNVERGNYVQAGQSILSIVTPEIWITANFKESQLDRMRPGQKVDIAIDAYPSLKLTGHIDSIQLGSGSRFTAFPPENATGNYVKIVQRVPVKILIDAGMDPAAPLPLGLSAVPTVHLAGPVSG